MFDENTALRIELVTSGFELSASEIADMERDLHTLRKLIDRFPQAVLHIRVDCHQRTKIYHVKTSLSLCGSTLFTGDRDTAFHPAFERCVHKLIKKIEAHKSRMSGKSEWFKPTIGYQVSMNSSDGFDSSDLEYFVAKDDYAAFRSGIDIFADGLSKRIGRWINRYPQIQEELGDAITISDIVEEVFLSAYQQFLKRTHDVPPSLWLEGLIDPAIQALLQSPDEEYANISFSHAILEKNHEARNRT